MRKITLRHLRVRVVAGGTTLGSDWAFEDGLNIIWAENTQGKSSVFNAILFALGLEILLGRKGELAMKPSLRAELEMGVPEETVPVAESWVELEIENSHGRPVLIKRYIRSDSHDDRLVVVRQGTRIAENHSVLEENFFLHDRGAAQREAGFHTFLANFAGWDLPRVSTFQGSSVPLYIECLFPLFFIEQVRGWTGIQATMPTRFGIRDVAKQATEFVLGLDVSEISRRRRELHERKAMLRSQWDGVLSSFNERVAQSPAFASLPRSPMVDFALQVPRLLVLSDGESYDVVEWLAAQRERINVIQGSATAEKSRAPSFDSIKLRLEANEERLFIEESRLSALRNELRRTESLHKTMRESIHSLEVDLQKNEDAQKLRKLGANIGSKVALGVCPTCAQEIRDVLLDQNLDVPPMTIDENVKFIKNQKELASAFLEIQQKEHEMNRVSTGAQAQVVDTLRALVREDRAALAKPSGRPDVTAIREMLALERQVARIEEVASGFDLAVNRLLDLADKWTSLLAEERTLPADIFSAEDKKKLARLERDFRSMLQEFEFKSTPIGEVGISRDSYRPSAREFELVFDSSASDNIRVLWAYTLALLSISTKHMTQHVGIACFDEPGQQQVSKASRHAFYLAASRLDPRTSQVLVTTSEEKEDLVRELSGVRHQFIDNGPGRVLKPVRP